MSLLTGNRFVRRVVKHHLPLLAGSFSAIWLLDWWLGWWLQADAPQRFYFRLSLATGYVALILLVITLSIGAFNVLRNKRTLISTDWRRDIGIWCALISLAHFIAGWNVHMKNRYEYFFTEDWAVRFDIFGLANDLGLLAILIVALLLVLSNDYSLRKLQARRWKSLQRWNYALGLLVIAHSLLYQFIEKRPLSLIAPIGLLMLFGIILQGMGRWKFRRLQQNV